MMRAQADGGSVLVDALVAIGVMSITLIVAAKTFGDGAVRTAAAERSRLADLEARSRLTEVGGDIPLAPGRASGEDGDFVWAADIASSSAASGPAPLFNVTVTVTGQDGKALATIRSLRMGAPS